MTVRYRGTKTSPPASASPSSTQIQTPKTAPASTPDKSARASHAPGGEAKTLKPSQRSDSELRPKRTARDDDGFKSTASTPRAAPTSTSPQAPLKPQVPVEQAMGPALASGKHSPTAAQHLDLKNPMNHPEAQKFQQSFTALGMSKEKTTEVWGHILHGVNHQEQLRADAKAGKGQSSDPSAPRIDTSNNPHFQKVATELGPHLRIPQGQGPMALWSGGYDVSKHAQQKGYTTLESTPAGKALSGLEIYKDPKAVTPMWNHLSEEFVKQNPQGPAHAFIRTHDPTSVLYRQEVQTLEKLSGNRPVVWHPLAGDKLENLQAIQPGKTLGADSAYSSEAAARKDLKDFHSATNSEDFAAKAMKIL